MTTLTDADRAALDRLFQTTDWRNIDSAAVVINCWADMALGPDRAPSSSLSKLVLEEIPELLLAKKEGRGLETEWADCMILLLDLAEIWGIEAHSAILKKMKINALREWDKDESTGFYNHRRDTDDDPDHGTSRPVTKVQRRQALDNNTGIARTDCRGAPIPSVDSSNVLIRSPNGWHTAQLIRAGGGWAMGACTRCGRDLDGRSAEPYQTAIRNGVAGDAEESEGTGVG